MQRLLQTSIFKAIMVVLVWSTLLVVGCSTPQARYKVLSFFFDGVPNPDATNVLVRQKSSGRPIYVHKPYADQQCNDCHVNTQDIFARAKVAPERCFDCHQNVLAAYPKMHGPVVSIQCMQCHSPHQSLQPHLLKMEATKLCLNCHLPETLSEQTPEHLNLAVSCINCHSGHGGEDLRFLKPAPPQEPQPMAANDAVEGVP